jgi:hypothetical protein
VALKILAFLQNQWVNEPEKVAAMIARNPKTRPRIIKYALFQSHTGHRLKQVFGDECIEWEWDNASPQIGGHSSSCFPADPEHIKAVLEEHRPDVVLTFGKVASDALKKTCNSFKLIVGPHPAARKDNILMQLEKMADSLKEYRNEKVLELDDNGRPR